MKLSIFIYILAIFIGCISFWNDFNQFFYFWGTATGVLIIAIIIAYFEDKRSTDKEECDDSSYTNEDEFILNEVKGDAE